MFYFDLTSKPPYAATPEDFIFELFPYFSTLSNYSEFLQNLTLNCALNHLYA